jgi:hypothetical protein
MLYNMLYNKLANLCKVRNMHSAKKYVYEESLKHAINRIKTHNCNGCYYCNGTGWIIWKSNNSNNILDLNKQPNIILYTTCFKCQ